MQLPDQYRAGRRRERATGIEPAFSAWEANQEEVACRIARSLRDRIDQIRETKLSEKTYIV